MREAHAQQADEGRSSVAQPATQGPPEGAAATERRTRADDTVVRYCPTQANFGSTLTIQEDELSRRLRAAFGTDPSGSFVPGAAGRINRRADDL